MATRSRERDDTHARLSLAISSGNLELIRNAVKELREPVPLSLAAQILSVIARRYPDLYEPAAVRWIGRLCAETSPTLEDLDEALTTIEQLRDSDDRHITIQPLYRLART